MTEGTLSELPIYGVDVRDLGAKGDGVSDDSGPIQAALDSGSPRVAIPYGVYKIGRTLRVGSNTHVLAHPRARLFFSDYAGVDQYSFLVTNRNPDHGDVGIRIEGGIWDGNNPHNPRGPDKPDSYTGVLISMTNVQGLTLRGLTVRDSESYFFRLCQVREFLIEQIRFEAPNLRPNQDGVHLGGYCEDGLIRNLRGYGPGITNDDLVALNADDANDRAQNLGKKNGPIQRVRVEDLSADDCHTFVRLLSVRSPIEDVTIENVRGGCQVSALNMDACRECRVQLFDPEDPEFEDGAGSVARVAVRGLNVFKSSGTNPKPLIDLRTRVRDFLIKDFRRNEALDVNPRAPSMVISDMQPCTVVAEDVAGSLMDTVQASSSGVHGTVQRLAAVDSEIRYRAEFQVSQAGALRLDRGGFGRLAVNARQRE